MTRPDLVETKSELRSNVSAFTSALATLAGQKTKESRAIANGCSHAVEWVAFQDHHGEWQVAYCKYVGYRGITPELYDQLRKTHMTGTDTKRRVEKFGGTLYGVGRDAGLSSRHPAVEKVREVCALMGKTPKLTAKVRVFTTDERPATMDVLVAAVRAANLNDDELDALFADVRKAA